MVGNPRSIELLNQAVTDERTAIHAYILKSVTVGKMGYKELAAAYKKRAIEEMQHLDKLIERILFLEGEPDLAQPLPRVHFIADIEGMLAQDHELEADAVKFYNDASSVAEALSDRGTKKVFEENLAGEEEHIDWLEDQIGIINDIGLERYLVEQI